MKYETRVKIIFVSIVSIILTMFCLGIIDIIYTNIEKKAQCSNDMLIETSTGHYCLTQNGNAQRVVFDCKGFLNDKTCEMFEVT